MLRRPADHVMKGARQGDLTMTPQAMRRLAAKATEALVERIAGLDDAKAWDGEFRGVLEGQLGGPPPEAGQSAEEVMELARLDAQEA